MADNAAAENPGAAAEASPKAGSVTDAAGLVLRLPAQDRRELRMGISSPSLSSNDAAANPPGARAGLPFRGSGAHPSILNLLVVILWSAGLAVLFLRLVFGLVGAVRLTSEGIALDDPAWRILLERFLALVSIRRTVRLKSHPEVLVPMTWGWRRPIVLLPDGAVRNMCRTNDPDLCH